MDFEEISVWVRSVLNVVRQI